MSNPLIISGTESFLSNLVMCELIIWSRNFFLSFFFLLKNVLIFQCTESKVGFLRIMSV